MYGGIKDKCEYLGNGWEEKSPEKRVQTELRNCSRLHICVAVRPPSQVQTVELLGRPSPLLQGNPAFGDPLGQVLRSPLQVREATLPTASPCHRVAPATPPIS